MKLTYDALDRLILAETPNGTVTYTYDSFDRRLTRIEDSIQEKYFYHESLEIGAYRDDKIVELKMIGWNNATIAIELNGQLYSTLCNDRGDLVCAYNESGGILSWTRYEAFGEMETFGLNLPWSFCSKRVDPVTKFVHFLHRDYVPSLARWLTPDPAGFADGINLYHYAHNNPLSWIDPLGLNAQENKDQPQAKTGPSFFDRMKEMGNSIHNSVVEFGRRAINSFRGPTFDRTISAGYGACHGGVDFIVGSLHDLETSAAYMGMGHIEMNSQEGARAIGSIVAAQSDRMATLENAVMGTLGVDRSDLTYQSFRSGTTLGLEVGSLVLGGYGAAKGIVKFNRLARLPMQGIKFSKTFTSNITPRNFFRSRSYNEMDILLTRKFGTPRPGAPGGLSFFNPQTKRTFHLHQQVGHMEGKAHVDIRRRGPFEERKYLLKEE